MTSWSKITKNSNFPIWQLSKNKDDFKKDLIWLFYLLQNDLVNIEVFIKCFFYFWQFLTKKIILFWKLLKPVQCKLSSLCLVFISFILHWKWSKLCLEYYLLLLVSSSIIMFSVSKLYRSVELNRGMPKNYLNVLNWKSFLRFPFPEQ